MLTRPSSEPVRGQVEFALAGTQFNIHGVGPWKAAVPRHQWPVGLAEQYGDEVYGDRRTELVCIGQNLDVQACMRQLEACVLSHDELVRCGVLATMEEQIRNGTGGGCTEDGAGCAEGQGGVQYKDYAQLQQAQMQGVMPDISAMLPAPVQQTPTS